MSKRKKDVPLGYEQMTTQQKMQYMHENTDIRKPQKPQKDPKKKRRMIYSVGFYFLGYLFLLGLIFGMIVLNQLKGKQWLEWFKWPYSDMLFLLVSVFLLVTITFFYFFFENRETLLSISDTVLIFTLIVVCSIIYYVCGRYTQSPYIRPFALFALLILFLLNRRQAIFLNFIFTFLFFVIDLYTNSGYEQNVVAGTHMIGFFSGTLAVFFAGNVKTRSGLIFTGVILALPTSIVVGLLNLSLLGTENAWQNLLMNVGYSMLGSIISAVLALALLPIFEAIFSKLTVFRLRELTSTNAPLLNRLKKEAPGTFNHSLIVAQLSEACAVAIGENAELARAAAYYHDVGKLKDPQCFTENQSDYNVHNELTPELSADIIRSHAQDGYDLLIYNHFPKAIADVALEHHGTLPVKYFFNKALRISGGEANIANYSYFGPTPRTRIAAIVMIADGAEAATRALKDHSPESVEKTVRGIIEERMDLGQFADCNITMRDLTIIKQSLVEALSGVHHHRVEYPSIRFKRDRSVEENAESKDKK